MYLSIVSHLVPLLKRRRQNSHIHQYSNCSPFHRPCWIPKKTLKQTELWNIFIGSKNQYTIHETHKVTTMLLSVIHWKIFNYLKYLPNFGLK